MLCEVVPSVKSIVQKNVLWDYMGNGYGHGVEKPIYGTNIILQGHVEEHVKSLVHMVLELLQLAALVGFYNL